MDIKNTHFLITGGAGFIGSHLTETLLNAGSKVTIIDDLSTGSFDNVRLFRDNPNFSFAIDSINNEMVLDRLTSTVDVVIHLAAAVGVKMIVERPIHTIETNVTGTEYVLKAALRYRAKVLLASTSEVYGKGCKLPFKEEDDTLLGPTCKRRWAYAASKMVDEFLALAYFYEHKLPIVIFRLFNTVGTRQTGRYGMVIPRFINQTLKGQPITVYGDGTQRRCFCDVRDVVKAIVSLAKNPQAIGNVFNVGSTEEIAIKELAEKVKKLTKSSSKITFIPYSQAYTEGFEDMMRRIPDTTKITELTNWKPAIKLEMILKNIYDYHLKSKTNPL